MRPPHALAWFLSRCRRLMYPARHTAKFSCAAVLCHSSAPPSGWIEQRSFTTPLPRCLPKPWTGSFARSSPCILVMWPWRTTFDSADSVQGGATAQERTWMTVSPPWIPPDLRGTVVGMLRWVLESLSSWWSGGCRRRTVSLGSATVASPACTHCSECIAAYETR